MTDATANRRNVFVLILAGLFLGVFSIMLWLGRWKLAFAYLGLGIAVVSAFFLLPLFGIVPPLVIDGISPEIMFGLVGLPVPILGIAHAISINREASERPVYSRWYIALIVPAAIGLTAAFAVRTFLYQPFNAPAASSVPSLMVGDYFFVSKFAYDRTSPHRGQLAVFKLPSNTQIDYVKRIIGLPGDRIQMRGGFLFINGEEVKKERVEDYVDSSPLGEGGGHPVLQYEETLPNGVKYRVLDQVANGMADNTIEYVVPAGHYFMMGDNRDNSEDSRFLDSVGYVPVENFVGPVVFRFWNSRGVPLYNRPAEVHPSN